ncbi:MAG: monophosphatase [Miltoncostaeaceae bacterium]|nr:monophosphatase [Miltoncostaeaceae bacterium]
MAEPAPAGIAAHRWLGVLRQAGRRIGEEAAAMSVAERRRPLGRGAGGDTTLAIDQLAEDIVLAELEALRAEGAVFAVLSEECGAIGPVGDASTALVVVDPIDGSLNARRGLPAFSTSIAIADGPRMGDVAIAYVRDHANGEEHTAVRGGGARTNDRPLQPPPSGRLEIVALEGASPSRLAAAAPALAEAYRVRVIGSIALSLCTVGAGRCDAMAGLSPARAVDIAAAQLFAREAGALVGMPAPEDLHAAPLDAVSRRPVVAAREPAALLVLNAALDRVLAAEAARREAAGA